MSFINRLILLVLVPMISTMIFGYAIFTKLLEQKDEYLNLKNQVQYINNISKIIHMAQIERGRTVKYLSNMENGFEDLKRSRDKLDKTIENEKLLSNLLDKLKITRNKVDMGEIYSYEAKNFYSSIVLELISQINKIVTNIEDKESRNLIQAHIHLSYAKEAIGQIRATLSGVFERGFLGVEDISFLGSSAEIYHRNILNFKNLSSFEFEETKIENIFNISNKLIKNYNLNNKEDWLSPDDWFKLSSEAIDILHKNEKIFFDTLENIVNKKLEKVFAEFAQKITFFVFIFVMPLILVFPIIKNTLKLSMELENGFLESKNLLKQYKNAVDQSSIITKTDINGKITYANDAFCKISGFDKKDLIGKNHNLIRHPDMPKEIFENMWHTIKVKKEPWSGEVKNIRQDGSSYWVKAFIYPLFNAKGEIDEFIAIRIDISEQKMMAEFFENELMITSINFDEAFHLQKEYENAIDNSTILTRTDLNGKITYVNDKFVEISGYSKSELIGKSHSVIGSSDTPKIIFENMWSKISKGEIWEGVLKNKSKNGDFFWTTTTIVPIKNRQNKIVEFLAIRYNLTDLFKMHEEIEATQREIVYKMGEIGESRSQETGNHVKRVAEYSRLLGKLYGLDEKNCQILFIASPMHDIGKVAIPDDILKKPAKLDPNEWEIMKSHANIGYEILKGSSRPILQAAAIVAKEHHEKWDGSGYPLGLSGNNIHIYGRITAIADVFDALGSDRYYKKAWEDEKIFKLLEDEKEKHFDPRLVEIFFENLDKFLQIRDNFRD